MTDVHIDNHPRKGTPVVLHDGLAHIDEKGEPLCTWWYGGPTPDECQRVLFDPARHTPCGPCWADSDGDA